MSKSTVPNQLLKQAKKRKLTVQEYVLHTVETEGSKAAAARKLNCSRATIEHHLKRAGMKVSIRFVATIEAELETEAT